MHLKLVLAVFAVGLAITLAADAPRRGGRGGQGKRGGPFGRGQGGKGLDGIELEQGKAGGRGPNGRGLGGKERKGNGLQQRKNRVTGLAGRTAEGRGFQGRRGPPSDRSPPAGDRFIWTRDLGSGETFQERAFAPSNTSLIMDNSFDPALLEANMTRASTLYDFSAENAVVAIRPGRRAPCFLTGTTLTYQSAIDSLNSRNDSTTTTSKTIDLDGTSEPLNREEADAVFKANPSLRRACRGTRLVVTVPAGSNPTLSDEKTRTLTLLTLDALITMNVPEPPPRPSQAPGLRPARPSPPSLSDEGSSTPRPRGGSPGPRGGPSGGPRGGPGGGPRGGPRAGPREGLVVDSDV